MKGIYLLPEQLNRLKETGEAQVRRVNKLANEIAQSYERTWVHFDNKDNWWLLKGRSKYSDCIESFILKSPYQVGEVAFVQEACQLCTNRDGTWDRSRIPIYKADLSQLDLRECDWTWQSPVTMPAWAARYFARAVEIIPQRLQDITEADIKCEGYQPFIHIDDKGIKRELSSGLIWYSGLWDSNNPKYPFEMNPWVWAYTLKLEARE